MPQQRDVSRDRAFSTSGRPEDECSTRERIAGERFELSSKPLRCVASARKEDFQDPVDGGRRNPARAESWLVVLESLDERHEAASYRVLVRSVAAMPRDPYPPSLLDFSVGRPLDTLREVQARSPDAATDPIQVAARDADAVREDFPSDSLSREKPGQRCFVLPRPPAASDAAHVEIVADA